MKKILPNPIAFCISMLFLAMAAIAFAVVNPEVRLWVRELPTELQAAVSAFAGTVIGLFAIAAAVVYHARSRIDDVASHRLNEARILAALLHGEIVALAQWLGAQAAAVEKNGSDNRLRSNEVSDGFYLGGFSTRAI